MSELADKITVVMGAGSSGPGMGNGKATAITFGREGATVVCADLNLDAAQETADVIRGEGGKATAVSVDVTKESQVSECINGILGDFDRIDVLDNNVGIGLVGGVTDLAEDDWDRVLAINLKGAAFAMKYTIPAMVSQGGGSIINISSVASIRWGGVAYATYYASKAALNHLTRMTAMEFASKQVRVNAVLPGLIKTPMVSGTGNIAEAYDTADVEAMWAKRDAMVPMGKMGEAWDVANAVTFLASDRSKYITGIELIVDGGIAMGFNKTV